MIENDERLAEFLEQRHVFLQRAIEMFPEAPLTLQEYLDEPPQPLDPVFVDDLRDLDEDSGLAIAEKLKGRHGVALVSPEVFQLPSGDRHHALLDFAEALRAFTDVGYPIDHPMEGHQEAVSRFGPPDGTLKIYNLPKDPSQGYREQAETDEMFHTHNDGLGYAGLIATAILTLDSPPRAGGYTYFMNMVRAAIPLAHEDPAAFTALFHPEALTALRPRGKGAIRVSSPVLYVGPTGEPQSFLRVTTGEYTITWREDGDLDRARRYLSRLSQPFGPAGSFAQLWRPGDTLVIKNQLVPHGRTAFRDPPTGRGRVLARKWFVRQPEEAYYRHVPGMVLDARWAVLYPEKFGDDVTSGDWNWDAKRDANVVAH